MNRVIGIGLDAAEWWLVEEMMAQGRMPNLLEMRNKGASGTLETVRAYRSELPWTMFWTGRSAEANGYWSTVKFDPDTYRVFEIGAYPGQPFWREMADGQVTTFDVPHLPVMWDRNDVQVSAWGANSPQYARVAKPRGLLDELEAKFGEHPAFERDNPGCWFDPEYLSQLEAANIVGSQRRASIVSSLADAPDWRLMLTVMSETHSIGHHAWHGVLPGHPAAEVPGAAQAGEYVRNIYEAVDTAVGRIARSAPDATIAVFALHGMQANTNELTSLVLLPELLHRAHYGEATLSKSPPFWNNSDVRVPASFHSWGMEIVRLKAESRKDRIRRDLRLLVPNPALRAKHAVAERLGRPVPGRDRFEHYVPVGESTESPEALAARETSCEWQPPCWWSAHWPDMPWFALPSYSDGHIRINLQGRERNGVVGRDDYRRRCDELATMLGELTNASNGKRVVEDVAFVRADDPFDPDGPTADVVAFWSEPAHVIEHPVHGRIGPLPYRRTGEHSSNGFLMVSGPGVPHTDLGEFRAEDVPPTLLGLLGHDAPADVIGTDLLKHVRPVGA